MTVDITCTENGEVYFENLNFPSAILKSRDNWRQHLAYELVWIDCKTGIEALANIETFLRSTGDRFFWELWFPISCRDAAPCRN